MMVKSFPKIHAGGLMNDFGLRLRLLLEKEPTNTQNWAAKYLKVAQFPFGLPASYGYYQTDNRISLETDTFKMYQQLRDDICECLDRTWYPKVIPLFVELPEVVEETLYHAVLLHIKISLETQVPVVTNAPNFGFDKFVNYLIGLCKIRPFALAYLKSRLVVPQDTQWNTISEFIDEHCRLQDVPVKENFKEKIDYLFGCISDRVILPLKNVSSKQLNEQNPKVKSAVQAVCRLLLEKMRANPSEACTESVKYEVNDQRYTVK
jgi:RNAse (barnase) inhibitor barstar